MLRSVCLCSILALVAVAGEAQEVAPAEARVLDLRVTGRLGDDALEALKLLIEQPDLERFIAAGVAGARPLDELCYTMACALPEGTDLAGVKASARASYLLDGAVPRGRTLPYVVTTAPSAGADLELRQFLVMNVDDPLVAPVRWQFGPGAEDLAIPIPEVDWVSALATGGVTNPTGLSGGSIRFEPDGKLEVVLRDLQLLGESNRQLRINHLLGPEERAQLIAKVQQDPGTLEVRGLAEQEDKVRLAPAFELATEGCSDSTPGWPFDVEGLARILTFGKSVLEQIGGWPPRRSRILVIDSGAHTDLLQLPAIAPLLYLNVSERMAAPKARRSELVWLDPSQNNFCLDFDGNGQFADHYGGSAHQEGSCLSEEFARARLNPIARKPGDRYYYPEHGSLVAVLAAGGPDLISRWPEVHHLLGLTFYRITTASKTPDRSVEIDPSDVDHALRYAAKIDADVVNVSFKTGELEIFDSTDLLQHSSLIVTSAGNGGEDLDGPAENNLPASLREDSHLRLQQRLIVVGALENDPDMPFWELSARSPTKVDIAAPGVAVHSFDHQGQRVCGVGTSVAAPLVTFTAAVLKALGLRRNEYIRERLELTAVVDDHLDGKVKGKRKLDVLAATDLFVDQVRLRGVPGYRRGWILTEGSSEPALLPVCQLPVAGGFLGGGRGKIDLPYLAAWRRVGEQGEVTHRMEDSTRLWAKKTESCEVPEGSLGFFDFLEGQMPIPWQEIEAVIPTPFRSVRTESMRAAGFDPS